MNYYEMLGLPCDGRQAEDIKLIQSTLKQWELSKTDALNNESQEAKRKVLRSELDELPNMQKLLSDAVLRKRHAEELKAVRLAQVDSIIGIMKKSRTSAKSIARARLDRIAVLIGLLPATIAERFKSAGYAVVESRPVKTNDFLMENRVLDKISGDLELIRNHMKSNPHEPLQEITMATNLYEYLAIMEGKSIEDADEYKLMTTDKLAALFSAKMMEHVRTTAPTMWYKDIESQAKTQVMKDDKQRAKYNNALKLQKLDSLLKLLVTIPVSIKLERAFADECIREIQELFPDEDQAIAIYNKYGEMPLESQYEKENTSIATMCTCHILNYHDTREQAENATCVSCGNPLYEVCPNCEKKVPAVSEFCSCGFFMKGRQSFPLHKLRFEAAVGAADLPKAQDEYNQAMACDPTNSDLQAMKAALSKLEKELGRSIEDIKNDLNARKINAAQQKLNALRAARPNVNVKQYQEQINTELAWAASEYAKLQKITNQGRGVELASQIVERVKDYSPALEWLRLHPPKPVQSVAQVSDSVALSCVIQWVDDPENRFVTYTVVRKEGAMPLNIQDGVQIASDLKSMQCKDTSLSPGNVYVYAVFAVRGDSTSQPIYSQPVCLLQNISEVQINISSSACTLSWQDIAGSRGVHIRRSEDGGKSYSVVCNCARGTFSDNHVSNNKQYRYSLKTMWEILGKKYLSSEELVRDVRVEQKPARVDIQLVNVSSDGNCQVQWKEAGSGTLCLLALKAGVTVVPDQVYGRAMLGKMGSIIVPAVPVATGKYAWHAERGRQYQVVALRSFGDDLVAGQAIRVSTVPALKIDKNRTTISNNTLNLYLADVPQQVSKIFYLVSMNDSVCTEQMAIQNSLPTVDVATFRRTGVITVEKLQQEKLTISLLAMYGTGSAAFYSPVTKLEISNQPKKRIEYWIEWQMRGFARRKRVRSNAKLYVRIEGDRLPEMELCCRDDGSMIFNYIPGSPGIVQLLKIDASQVERGNEFAFDIPERSMKGLPANTDIQLFLSPEEQNSFSLPLARDPSSRKMPAE